MRRPAPLDTPHEENHRVTLRALGVAFLEPVSGAGARGPYIPAMRKVVLWIGMSLDGFTSDAEEKLEWLVPHATGPEGQEIYAALRRASDTVLVGRVNYEGFFQYWPRVIDDPLRSKSDREIARWIDEVPKVVFSRTLRELKWKNSRRATGSPEEELASLRRAPGKDILIQNSTRLAQSLLARGLVDELQLVVAPVAVGSGRPLFAGVGKKVGLRLLDARRFGGGGMGLRYEVKH